MGKGGNDARNRVARMGALPDNQPRMDGKPDSNFRGEGERPKTIGGADVETPCLMTVTREELHRPRNVGEESPETP